MTVGLKQAPANARHDPDVVLMLAVRMDDAAAFRQLIERYRDLVHQQLYLMVGSREEAEDLTQEVFLRLYRHRKTYLPRAKFATWLFHIVRNLGRNSLRDRRRRPALPLSHIRHPDDSGVEPSLPDPREPGPTQPLERQELRQAVRSALDRLGLRQRRALELHQFEDRSYTEVADCMALSPQAAKSLLYRARNQLREALTPYLDSATPSSATRNR